MASNPLFIIPYFFFAFSKWTLLSMAALGLKKMGKFLLEGREKNVYPIRLPQFNFP